jgi:colanic acid biosynthesis glycosyl transferase WcaI
MAIPRTESSVVLRGTRIAVVGINYAPETSGIAPYTTEMCEFLASAGAEVTVLTGIPHYPEWRVTHG